MVRNILYALGPKQELTPGASITWAFDGRPAVVDLSANGTLTVTGPIADFPMVGLLKVTHTVAGTELTLPGDSSNVVWSSGAEQHTILEFMWDGLEYVWKSHVRSAVAALTQLEAPTGFTATAVSASQIDLAWTDSTNESGYKVYRNTVDSLAGATLVATLAANTTAYQSTGLSANTSYYFYLVAKGDGATYSDSPAAGDGDTTHADSGQLSTPANFAAAAVSASQIDLTWTDGANELYYAIYRNTVNDQGTATLIYSTTPSVTSYNDTGLSASTQYFYWIKAVGDGATFTDSAYATTNATTEAAAGPTTLHASAFTAANGTAIGSYTPETGNVWVNVLGEMEVQSNRMVGKTPNGGGFFVASTEVSTGNVHLTATGANAANSAEGIAFYVRFTDMNNHIVVVFNKTYCDIYDIVGGTATNIFHSSNDPGTTEHTFEVIVSGTSLQAKIDGAALTGTIPALTSNQTGTKVCVQLHGAANTSYVDSLTVTTP